MNSVGHLVVPPTQERLAFMLGIDDTGHSVTADLHTPFLVQVPRTPEMLEIVAMNMNLASLGAVRVVPENEVGSSFCLELRHQVPASLLTQDGLNFYVELLPRLGDELVAKLQPAVGGRQPPLD